MSGANLMAFIGFWQSDRGVGVTEQGGQPGLPVAVTRLERVFPNPSHSLVHLSYSLAAETPVRLEIVALSGRVIRRLVNSRQRPGGYRLTWNCRDQSGRPVSSGVYFLRFDTGEHREVLSSVKPVSVKQSQGTANNSTAGPGFYFYQTSSSKVVERSPRRNLGLTRSRR